ncbi:MAG TPA: DUF3352 domain-containing protein [Ktedonobacterales bacterium]|nr:DUF3352 domain-containing protein [Ktedonobacterales bacterium]
MSTGQQSAATGHCPGCGQSIDAHAVYCPNCGRPYYASPDSASMLAAEPTQSGAYATAPVQSASTGAPPPLPEWVNQPTATGGIAGLGAGAALAPEQPIRSHKRRNVLTAISALVVVGLLAGGAYWAYAAFAARNSNQLAHYFPSNTVVFASVDLVAAANNNFHMNPADLAGPQATQLQRATGLDWQKDVVSWAGPDLALGVFPLSKTTQTGATTGPIPQVGVVVLVQSHDDGAARAMLAKINTHAKQQGTTPQATTYRGFTLYAPSSDASQGASQGMYGSGGGWVIIASNAEAAHAVIDRVTGGSDSLSDQQPFKDATDNLPSNHFGTYYVNVREMMNSIVPVRAPNGLASISVPFVESYPVAGGYIGWTNTGERSQITFNAARNPNIPDVSGDTTGFAALAPSDAMAYAGAGNVGKFMQAVSEQFGTAAAGVDPLQSSLGISSSDPMAQQPVGVAAIKGSNAVPQPVFYVHVSDSSAASQLVAKIATARHWTTKPTTIGGQAATALYETASFGVPPTGGDGTPGAVNETAHLVAVALTLRNTLVLAPDTATAATIVQVAQGSTPSLASNATFQKLIKAAPSGAAITAYIGASAFQSLASAPMGSAAQSGLVSHIDALALSLVWNNSVLQGTFDAGLHA